MSHAKDTLPCSAGNLPVQFHTLMICCPVCGSDVAETLGVTGKMDRTLEATVIMSCGECESVYLSPPPHAESAGIDAATVTVYKRSILDLKDQVPANHAFFCADADETTMLERDPDAGRFDRIALLLTLESSRNPVVLLEKARALLADGGQLALLAGNSNSSCFRTFGGRHWCGYRYPTARQYFSLTSVKRAAESAGLRVASARTTTSANAWLLSLRNLLKDWGAHNILVAVSTGRWLVPWLFASLFEAVAAMRGRAAILVVQLEKVNEAGNGSD